MPTQLTTPTITLSVVDKTTIRASGLSVAHALGYQVRISTLAGGGVPEKVSPVDGVVEFTNRSPRTLYFVSARALGDDEDYTNSDWTAEQTVQTGTDVDQALDVPNIGAVSESFTTLAISGLAAYKEYRVQIATSVAALDDAVPRVIGSGDGSARLMGLEPGTSYFVRACLVDGDRCSLWSDVVSAVTSEISATVEVTSGNDSGTGTLRQAISDAADGTKILLKVSSITLNTLISTAKRLFIVGGLADRTVISAGNGNGLFTGAYLDFRHVAFTGAIGANRVINSAARLDDCLVYDVVGTGTSGYLSDARIYRSICRGNTAARNNLSACMIYDSVIDTNTATSKSSVDGGGGAYNASVSNCTLVGNIANYGGGASGGTLTSCTITGNTAANGGGAYTGTLVDCTLSGNTASNTGGGANGSTLINCVITGNTSTGNGGGAYGSTLKNCRISENITENYGGGVESSTANNCYLSSNTGRQGGGSHGGTLTNCVIIGNTATDQGGGANSSTIINCLVINNVRSPGTSDDLSGSRNYVYRVINCTVGSFVYTLTPQNTSMYNTLYATSSVTPTAGNTNNLSYADAPGSYFVDAANGDYRLKFGSPAINAGDNQYVTTDTDLAGNPRIGNGTVDVGCYEFDPYKIPAPTFSIDVQPGGQATIAYTLPTEATGFCLQYADNADFDDAHEITSDASSFDLAGLSGDVWLRAKSVGTPGQTLDSDWTEAQRVYFDVFAPIVTVNQTPLEIVYGDAVDFLDGVTVSDDGGAQCTVHYQVLDGDGLPVTIDGQTQDIPSGRINKGRYTLRISATDDMGNTGHADRVLIVEPPRLTTPTIELKSIQGTTVVISGLLDSAAVGWLLSVDGAESPVTPNAGGQVVIPGLANNTTHLIKAKALGDWVDPEPPEQPSGDFRDSIWSNTLSVTIGGDTPADAPVLSQKAITDHTLTLEVSGLGANASYLEILLSTDAGFSSPMLVTKVPKAEIVIDGLKASQIYFVRARGYYGTTPTSFSSTLVVETEAIQGTSPADKLAYIRARIALLRDYLAESANLSTISIDGISETRVDRSALRAELEALEAEESRLMSGGGRLRTIDARWVI